ncbi:GreA/GreB family elongation factor [Maribacter sp. SA7]|uniref:GreA/GreB family elongation factor n=1 Tax=Maribacter zhoushanensis TaxID=3030012 RepID=UPI0023ED2240|nr:GreA/GreB family elongation factor [Maribacter zhoushanensis]MDF4203017.1 GreA/GreB family elongation factor [Maribacter zhoushanensis]
MSRGFVKEEDQEEIPMVPPRADLPNAVTNYVTSIGYNNLLAEKKSLTIEKESLQTNDEKELRIANNLISAKMQLLNERISTAKIVDLSKQPENEVRFGATVLVKIDNATTIQQFQIAGVDEADIAKGKISFLSPIARMLISKQVGDTTSLNLGKVKCVFKIVAISYS